MNEFPVNIDMFQVVVGLLLPAAIAVIVKEAWSSKVKALVSIACVVAAATAHLFFLGGTNWADLPGTILKIGYISGTTYLAALRPLGVTDWIEQNINGGRK